ncbi:hypothetical protein K501DRAFT_250901 [Backusella circina FSU 941]|nr:hypothetical protein K501DRAFT_250901 [Backusella circina FSU 941]
MLHKNNFVVNLYTIILISTILLVTYYGFQRYTQESSLIDNDTIETINNKRRSIDYKYCKGPCKFINFIHLPEQETRSQTHLRHISFTAGLANRTIVLPNVGGSRIGGCKEHSFDFYYDMDWAASNRKYFHSITMNDYKSWLQERHKIGVPATSNLFVIKDEQSSLDYYLKQKEECFDYATEPILSYTPIMNWEKGEQYKRVGKDKVATFLRGDSVDIHKQKQINGNQYHYEHDQIEVIDLFYAKGHQFMRTIEASEPIPYSKVLVDLSKKIVRDIEPYVAVHWRMETIRSDTDILLDCAQNLVSTLNANFSGMNVFLLTDYPHTFTKEQQDSAIQELASNDELISWVRSPSDTFNYHRIKPIHHRAIQYLYAHKNVTLIEPNNDGENNATSPPPQWNLIHIPKQLDIKNNANRIDSGWLGILDKIIAIQAEAFLAGEPDVCARDSTFTAQIIAQRNKQNDTSPVYYFGSNLPDEPYTL